MHGGAVPRGLMAKLCSVARFVLPAGEALQEQVALTQPMAATWNADATERCNCFRTRGC